jgi:hypothetical protein
LGAVPIYGRNNAKIRYTALFTPDTDLRCFWFIAPQCDPIAVFIEASKAPYDKIVVIWNYSTMSGGHAAYGFSIVAPGTENYLLGRLTAHEMGHDLGKLGDEYNAGLPAGFAALFPNCDEIPLCPKWYKTPGTGCFEVCGAHYAYRSMETSIMKDLDTNEFGPVGDPIMQAAIDGYAGAGGEGNSPPPLAHGCGCGASCAAGARCAFGTGEGCDPGFDCVPGGAEGYQCYSAQYCTPGQDNCPGDLQVASADNGDFNLSWTPVLDWNLRYRLTVTDITAGSVIYETSPIGTCVDDGGEATNMDAYDCDGQYACPVPNRNHPPPGNTWCTVPDGERGLPKTASSWTVPATWLTAGHQYKISVDGGDGPEGTLPNCAPLEKTARPVSCSAKTGCSGQYRGYQYTYTPLNYPACTIGNNPPDGGWPNWPADYTCRPDVCSGTCTNTVTGCSNQYHGYRYSFVPANYPDCVVGRAPACGGTSWPGWSGDDTNCDFNNQNHDDYTRDVSCGAVRCATPTPTRTPAPSPTQTFIPIPTPMPTIYR